MSVAQPLRHAWRSLRRTPAFTITAVLTLVIGIGAAVAIFAVVNGVLLRPLPYGDPERLVGTWHALPGVNLAKANQTSGTYFTYQRFAQTIENLGLAQEGAVNVSEPGGVGEPQRLSSSTITATLIPTLQVSPLLGRNFTDAEDRPDGPEVVIISERLWRNRFAADPDVVGRTMDVNGVSRQIVAVMPARFRYPTAETQLWFPMRLDPNASFSGGFNYHGIARLKPGVSPEAAQRDFTAVLPRLVELFPLLVPGVSSQVLLDQARPSPLLVPLRQDQTADIARTLWMVAAAAGLVLLVACANVANLVLVRADSRQRELAVREALGAGRARVLAHFLGESALLAVVAAALGLIVAWIAVRALVLAGPAGIPRLEELSLDATTVLFALVVATVAAGITSVIPALRIGRVPLFHALREGGRGGTAGKAQHRLRGAMVALQIALALVVLAGSGLLVRTFQRLSAVRPGFDGTQVATFWLSLPRARYANDSALVRFWSTLTERVTALPGVRSVGLSSRLPLLPYGMNQNPFYAEDDPTTDTKIPPLQLYTAADGGYFRTMGIPLVAGRLFDRIGVQRAGEAIVSQRTAEQFWKDPTGQAAIGKRFRTLPNSPWHTVVGVVGDARDTSLAATPAQTVYFPLSADRDTLFGQGQRTLALVVQTTGEPTAIVRPVQSVVRELDPTLPTFEVRPMSAVTRASMARLSFTIVILGAAAVVTLLLGAVGLYGVMAYLVTLRTRELGVRLALGAQPRAVAAMMTRQGLALTVLGIAGGLVLFALVARFLRAFLFGVAPTDPATLVAASLLLVGVAALASWIPARRASRVDPAETLRAE
ncbi:MAG TPA: ABC transporter permease [Gemmatimonadaceae bacterium]|nr:ABC transporter permease [Gemmatimonadaceae bacterium]